ncbi:MAG: hypothetical protein U0R64_08990 [Candidatus Nanopelagicales bacterium]
MRSVALGAVAALSLGVLVPVPAHANTDSTYDLAVELLNRASGADQAARDLGGWSGTAQGKVNRRSRDDGVSLLIDIFGSGSDSGRDTLDLAFATDLRHGRIRADLDGDKYLLTRELGFSTLIRTAKVRRALRIAGRPHAHLWRAPVPTADSSLMRLGLNYLTLPSTIIQSVVGPPSDVTELTRTDDGSRSTYRGSAPIWGESTDFAVTLKGAEVTSMAVRAPGRGRANASFEYGRPSIKRPGTAQVIGTTAITKAYAIAVGGREIRRQLDGRLRWRWTQRRLHAMTQGERIAYVRKLARRNMGFYAPPPGCMSAEVVMPRPHGSAIRNGARVAIRNKYGIAGARVTVTRAGHIRVTSFTHVRSRS